MKTSVIPVVALISLSAASLIPRLPANDHQPYYPLLPRQSPSGESTGDSGGQTSGSAAGSTPATTLTPTSQPETSAPVSTPGSQSLPTSHPETDSHIPTPSPSPSPASQSSQDGRSTLTSPAARTSFTQQVTSTNEQGIVTVIQFVTNAPVSSASSAKPSETSKDGGGGGMGTGSIAGMAVAGGLFGLGLIGFIWWKFSKKRFAGFENHEGNDIKWPELKDANALQPLPPRAGGTDSATEFDHRIDSQSIRASPYAYDNQSTVSSTADLTRVPVEHAYNDQYGVPHAGQQYYDDPNAASYSDARPGYYDPYRGPVPSSLDGHSNYEPSGRASPGPNMAYGNIPSRSASPAMTMNRSTSPGPNMAYGGGRSASPGPNMAYRSASPGPNMAYPPSRSGSPGPNVAYGMGRAPSPGPNLAYGGQPRSQSPGPNAAYGGP